MNIVLRTDASTRIGSGHLMRCMRLAQALRARGAQVRFVCRRHPGELTDLLRRQGLAVAVLPAVPGDGLAADADYAAWLGVTQERDAHETLAALAGETPDWLVVDHYGLGVEWERRLRPHSARLMAIDDLPGRAHDCDLLLDQNHGQAAEQRFAGLVPAHCRLLLGPRHALLGAEFAEHGAQARERTGAVARVLVFFGGSDVANLSGMALQALSAPALSHLEVDLVLGANHPHAGRVAEQARARPRTRVHGPLPHLADLMAQADLAVGAGGVTTWERMCLGLPGIVVAVAANQQPACEALARDGLIDYLGTSANVTAGLLERRLLAALSAPGAAARQSRQGRLLVDGRGALRVAEVLMPTQRDALVLRPAQATDAGLLHGWANEPEVRRHAIQTRPIGWDEHRAWFARKLADPDSALFVLQAGPLPVGQIRFDAIAAAARIDYALDPLVRGRGWGRTLVALGMEHAARRGARRFVAQVKPDNVASAAVFRSLGFVEQPAGLGLIEFSLTRATPQLKERAW